MNEYNWKNLALRELFAFRILFVLHLIWDFFLTVSVPSSMRARVLLDVGVPFAPCIIVSWAAIIAGSLILIFVDTVRQPNIRQSELLSFSNYLVLLCAVILYSVLCVISVLNMLVIWPFILSYAVGLVWSCILLYFRYKHRRWGR